MWITWSGDDPVDGVYADVDGHSVPIVLNRDKRVLSFPVGTWHDGRNVYLVDPDGLKRQRIEQ